MPRLLAALSGHGHGHVVQIAPLLTALAERIPELELVVQSGLPESLITAKLHRGCRVLGHLDDVGMVMNGPMRVDARASFEGYRRQAENWDEVVARQIALTRVIAPDLVLADVPHVPLAAAQALGVRNVALCSLNWADVFAAYCSGFEGAAAIEARIRACYQRADMFLRAEPAMPMRDLGNARAIGVLARQGRERREELRARLGLDAEARVVMVSLGGTPGSLPVSAWETPRDLFWLLPADWECDAGHCVRFEGHDWPFEDVLRSCDALLCKPGYGAFSYAVCNGVPLVYARRPDWPEESALIAWANEFGVAVEVGGEVLHSSGPLAALANALEQPPAPPCPATGADDGVRILAPLLAG